MLFNLPLDIMRMKPFIIFTRLFAITWFMLTVHNVRSSCFGPMYTLSEVLIDALQDQHIFTCQVLETVLGSWGWLSTAIVDRRYRGRPADTVYIETGGMSTAGGTKLLAGEHWLIVSSSVANRRYGATVCHNLSRNFDAANKYTWSATREKAIIESYQALVSSKHTGPVHLQAAGVTYARGSMIEGKAGGKWMHYYPQKDTSWLLHESDYVDGLLHGTRLSYRVDGYPDTTMVVDTQWYESGKQTATASDRSRVYTNQGTRADTTVLVYYNEEGIEVRRITVVQEISLYPIRPPYLHGPYYNRSQSKFDGPKGEGEYYHGRPVGYWRYFDDDGRIAYDTTYSHEWISQIDSSLFIRFDHHDTLVVMTVDNDTIQDRWRYRWIEGTLRQRDISVFTDGSYRILDSTYETYYDSQHQRHGIETCRYPQSNSQTITHWVHGIKHGDCMRYDTLGRLMQQLKYHYGLATTVYDIDQDVAPLINGARSGYHIQRGRDGSIRREGRYYKGYMVGEWTYYTKDGYTVEDYGTESDAVSSKGQGRAKISKWYDLSGELIKVIDWSTY